MKLHRIGSLGMVAGMLLVLPAILGFVAPAATGSNVAICHYPDEKGIGNILEVGRSAVPSHIAH